MKCCQALKKHQNHKLVRSTNPHSDKACLEPASYAPMSTNPKYYNCRCLRDSNDKNDDGLRSHCNIGYLLDLAYIYSRLRVSRRHANAISHGRPHTLHASGL